VAEALQTDQHYSKRTYSSTMFRQMQQMQINNLAGSFEILLFTKLTTVICQTMKHLLPECK